ncbi:MAG: hypothetical protein AAFW81_07295 [Pseudomonadota bacterium]
MNNGVAAKPAAQLRTERMVLVVERVGTGGRSIKVEALNAETHAARKLPHGLAARFENQAASALIAEFAADEAHSPQLPILADVETVCPSDPKAPRTVIAVRDLGLVLHAAIPAVRRSRKVVMGFKLKIAKTLIAACVVENSCRAQAQVVAHRMLIMNALVKAVARRVERETILE